MSFFYRCVLTYRNTGRKVAFPDCIGRSEPDGTRWRTGGEVKGKDMNGVGSQQPCTVRRNMVYPLIRTPRLPVVDWTDPPADLNGLVRFAERSNLVSARVPSRFERALPQSMQALLLRCGYFVYKHLTYSTVCVQGMRPRKEFWIFSEFVYRHSVLDI